MPEGQVVEVPRYRSRVVAHKYNIEMTVSKMQCLRPGTWLNDEAINFYMAMLQERSDTKVKAWNFANEQTATKAFLSLLQLVLHRQDQ